MAVPPKPNLDLFVESPCLVAKKDRHSTPSLRPPKPPTKVSKLLNRSLPIYLTSSTSRTRPPRFDIEIINKIGSGHFADVFKAKSLKDGRYYAIKKTSIPYTSNSDRSRKLQEVKNHKSLPPHPNCVRFYDSWEEDGYLYIQTELCKTSLNELIEESEGRKLSEQVVWNFLSDLLLAIKHLHSHDLLHLDIKPDNIFISFDGLAKLGDFGLMCHCTETQLNTSEALLATPKTTKRKSRFSFDVSIDHNDSGIIDSIDEGDSKYLASETMQGRFTKAADIFSLGITIFEVASGLDLPQRGEAYHKLRHNEIEDHYFDGLSNDLISVIKAMMEEDYAKRPSAQDLLHSDIIKRNLQQSTERIQIFDKGIEI